MRQNSQISKENKKKIWKTKKFEVRAPASGALCGSVGDLDSYTPLVPFQSSMPDITSWGHWRRDSLTQANAPEVDLLAYVSLLKCKHKHLVISLSAQGNQANPLQTDAIVEAQVQAQAQAQPGDHFHGDGNNGHPKYCWPSGIAVDRC